MRSSKRSGVNCPSAALPTLAGHRNRHRVPLCQRRAARFARLHAEPREQRVHVVEQLLLGRRHAAECRLLGLDLRRQVGVHRQEEVPALVQEGREVGVVEKADRQRCGVEGAAADPRLALIEQPAQVGRYWSASAAPL